eukprot:scaffold2407_cov57-Cyclotella_meneghiniana.AAC.1
MKCKPENTTITNDGRFPSLSCRLVVVIVLLSPLAYYQRIFWSFEFSFGIQLSRHKNNNEVHGDSGTTGSVNVKTKEDAERGGYWKYVEDLKDAPPPYIYSSRVCNSTYLHIHDCIKTDTCPSNLMNWEYISSSGEPYQRFDVDGFRRKMRNRRIIFVGPSMSRQQVLALVWTLGHESVDWVHTHPNKPNENRTCTTPRHCMTDVKGNITICHQFMGSMATKVYTEGNFSLDHSLRGHGDSSCLLQDEMIAEISDFDVAFVQEVSWWTALNKILVSPSSPLEWVSKMIPKMYYDSMRTFLTKISNRTKTVFVLGQIGVNCKNKSKSVSCNGLECWKTNCND